MRNRNQSLLYVFGRGYVHLSFHEFDCNICFGWACCALRICWLTAVVLGILQSSAALLKGSRQGYNRQQRNCWRPSMVRSLWGRCRLCGSGALLCRVHWYHGYWGQRWIPRVFPYQLLNIVNAVDKMYRVSFLAFWLSLDSWIFTLEVSKKRLTWNTQTHAPDYFE